MASQDSQATTTGEDEDLPAFSLSALKSIFVLPLRLNSDQLIETENILSKLGAPLTYDVSEAQIFIGKVTQKRRALFELRTLQVQVEQTIESSQPAKDAVSVEHDGSRKRRRLSSPQPESRNVVSVNDSSTDSETEPDAAMKDRPAEPARTPVVVHKVLDAAIATAPSDPLLPALTLSQDSILVLSLTWLEKSVAARSPQALEDHVILRAERIATPSNKARTLNTAISSISDASTHSQASIMSRARAELGPDRGQSPAAWASSSQHRRSGHPSLYNARTSSLGAQIPALVHQTTSEHDMAVPFDLPQPPDWVINHSKYSCERVTPLTSPNEAFINQLKTIRLARKLTGDEIGVRAYSTSIAAIAAYPHPISDPREVLALPGCEGKIAALWSEWHSKNTPPQHTPGSTPPALAPTSDVLITAAQEATDDPKLTILRLFYEIWGVGDKTARDFYNAGWRDLDDVVEFGWNDLSRVQQIGVKYYDEFQAKILRAEVESIAAEIHKAAQRVCKDSEGVRSCIVGGYRRGKQESGDVDVIVSHVDEAQTIDLVQEIVRDLVERDWITHELSTSLSGSRRGQATLPYRGAGGGHGFDTLDKALVVWQDPRWEGRPDLPKDVTHDQIRRKNPNVHRRVDIIIAPWSKIGCAVLGWSAGTTFERDLRRYAKDVKSWKFDSSGIRDRATGKEVDLEAMGGQSKTPEEAERRVFEGLGLVYREPWERCTG